MKNREYFDNKNTAWNYAQLLPKNRFTILNYGVDTSKTGKQFFIEYEDKPKYLR